MDEIIGCSDNILYYNKYDSTLVTKDLINNIYNYEKYYKVSEKKFFKLPNTKNNFKYETTNIFESKDVNKLNNDKCIYVPEKVRDVISIIKDSDPKLTKNYIETVIDSLGDETNILFTEE